MLDKMLGNQSSQKRELYQFDPIARFFLQVLHLNPFTLALLFVLLGAGFYLFMAWLSNTLWATGTTTGLLQDWLPWVAVLLINPIVAGYYLWSFQSIAQVIEDLELSDVLATDAQEIQIIERIAIQAYRPRWRIFLALGSAWVFSIFVLATRSGLNDSWTNAAFLPRSGVTIMTFVIVYLGSMLVLNLIANIWILHRILKRGIQREAFVVNPLHPDRCGGLRSLSDYALKTAYLAAALGIFVGVIEYQFLTQGVGQDYWFVHLLVPLYVLLSIACFFGPLVAAHRGMKRAKEKLLRQIARQFQMDYEQIYDGLVGEAATLKQGGEKIKELREFYTLTDQFPIWPFDTKTFRQFLITASSPLLPFLFKIGQSLVKLGLKRWGIELG